jgi:GntR family transcriptional regulator
MRAYSDLEQEGFVVNVHGKGCYVQPQNSDLIREQMLREVEAGLAAAISAAKIAKLRKDELVGILDVLAREEGYE